MKKCVLVLAAWIGISAGIFAYAGDDGFDEVVDSLRECAYAGYENQSEPSLENAAGERNACSACEELIGAKGVGSLNDYFDKHGWFYNGNGNYVDGKLMRSHYAAKIVKKFEKDGVQVLYTRLGKGVDSFKGFTYDMKYVNTVPMPDGTKKIVIDLEKIEKDAVKIEKQWKSYKSNHAALLKNDLKNWNPFFEPMFLSLEKYDNIRKGYVSEILNAGLAHELEHVKGDHAYDDINGEEIAVSAEFNVSPARLRYVQKDVPGGMEAEKEVLKCLMGTEDIFNEQQQAGFYLKGKKYIRQKAADCKQQFLKRRE